LQAPLPVSRALQNEKKGETKTLLDSWQLCFLIHSLSMSDYENLFNICKVRKSTRVFEDRLVPGDMIEKIKTIARTSPYASGKKNWEIMEITDKLLLQRMAQAVKDRAGDIQNKIRTDMQAPFAAYAQSFTFFASAPVVFVPTFRVAPSLSLMHPEPGPEIIQWERDSYVKSISCVGMLILLAAESLGLGACYVTGALLAEKEIGQLLKLPKERCIGALIPVGFKKR
jgi:nitroreductase